MTPRCSDNVTYSSAAGGRATRANAATGAAGVTYRCDFCRRQWAQAAGRKRVRGMWMCSECVTKKGGA